MSIAFHTPGFVAPAVPRARTARHAPQVLAEFARRSAELARDEHPDTVLDRLAAAVRPLTRMRTCAVVVIDTAAGPLRRAGVSGLPRDYVDRLEAGRRRGAFMATREAFLVGHPVLTPHCREAVLRDPRWSVAHDLVREADWDAFLAVPLLVRGRTIGSLTGFFGRGDAPDDAEVDWIARLAEQVALAVDDAASLARLRVEATETERGRLARDLHDSVAQMLYALSASARGLELRAGEETGFAADLVELRNLARSALTAMRATIAARRPLELDGEDLPGAVRRFAASASQRSGVDIEVACASLPSLPVGVEDDVFHLVQEAVNNVVKHARATSARIFLGVDDRGGLLVMVTDDGIGPGRAGATAGYGLQIMRERANRHRGELTIEAARPGTTVRLRLPLD
jgi:signal transduction histidine kinase